MWENSIKLKTINVTVAKIPLGCWEYHSGASWPRWSWRRSCRPGLLPPPPPWRTPSCDLTVTTKMSEKIKGNKYVELQDEQMWDNNAMRQKGTRNIVFEGECWLYTITYRNLSFPNSRYEWVCVMGSQFFLLEHFNGVKLLYWAQFPRTVTTWVYC